jgi:hypothetical protein
VRVSIPDDYHIGEYTEEKTTKIEKYSSRKEEDKKPILNVITYEP